MSDHFGDALKTRKIPWWRQCQIDQHVVVCVGHLIESKHDMLVFIFSGQSMWNEARGLEIPKKRVEGQKLRLRLAVDEDLVASSQRFLSKSYGDTQTGVTACRLDHIKIDTRH